MTAMSKQNDKVKRINKNVQQESSENEEKNSPPSTAKPVVKINTTPKRRSLPVPNATRHKGSLVTRGTMQIAEVQGAEGTSRVQPTNRTIVPNSLKINPLIRTNNISDVKLLSTDNLRPKSMEFPRRKHPVTTGVGYTTQAAENLTKVPETSTVLPKAIKIKQVAPKILSNVTSLSRLTDIEDMKSLPLDFKFASANVARKDADLDNTTVSTLPTGLKATKAPVSAIKTSSKKDHEATQIDEQPATNIPLVTEYSTLNSVAPEDEDENQQRNINTSKPGLINYSSSDLVIQPENAIGAQELTAKADLVRNVNQIITTNAVVIFSKTYCPFSMMAKEIFTRMNWNYVVVELDKRSDGQQIQDILMDMTGARTVPRVFVRGQFIGGGMDVRALFMSGELQRIVENI